jgi:hypothetical protein
MPGNYVVKLIVDGKTFTQSLPIRIDPRVKTATADLQKQHDLSMICYEGRKKCMESLNQIRIYRSTLNGGDSSIMGKQLSALENTPQGSHEPSFASLNNNFASLQNILQETDMPPTTQTAAAVSEAQKQLNDLLSKWSKGKSK